MSGRRHDGPATRQRILDAVEGLMVTSGHASVSYRAVARRAGATPSLVQHHFPTLDDLLVATVRRRAEQSLRHLQRLLAARPDDPWRAIWEFSNDETDAALTIELSALGHHRASVRDEITGHTHRLRAMQLDALTAAGDGPDGVPPAAALFLLSGIPKMLRMEAGFDVRVGHAEIVDVVEGLLSGRRG